MNPSGQKPPIDTSEGTDLRPKDTLDRDTDDTLAPTTIGSAAPKDPLIDHEGKPLTGDGRAKSDQPVAKPSTKEAMPRR